MSLVCRRLVRHLLLAVVVIGVTSCASRRSPTYVFTGDSQVVEATRDDRSTAPRQLETRTVREPEMRTDRAPVATRPTPVPAAAPVPAARIGQDAEEGSPAGASRFARARRADPVQPMFTDGATNAADMAPRSVSARIRPGDPLVIQLRGVPNPSDYELIVDDMGFIHLPYVPPIRAEGLTVSELQRRIQDMYVEERIYRQITVNAIMPAQSYYVRGEVRQPGRFPLTSGITVLKAIASAGGYTEFANSRRINIIRAGETMVENARQMEQNPEEDIELKAGDVIIVPRSIF